MNICILDDNEITVKCVNKMISESCITLKIPTPNIFCFVSSEEFLMWFSHDRKIDIFFLDIDLKSKINGIAIAKIVKEINYHTLLVFMTSYNDYISEIVQVEPFRFLEKPFNHKDFHTIFAAAYNRITLKDLEQKCIYKFKNNGIIYLVNLNEIIHISSYKRKIIMLNINANNLEFYGKLDDVEKEIKLITRNFVRINKSYLFNIKYIENIGKNDIVVQGITYHISPKYKHNIEIIT